MQFVQVVAELDQPVEGLPHFDSRVETGDLDARQVAVGRGRLGGDDRQCLDLLADHGGVGRSVLVAVAVVHEPEHPDTGADEEERGRESDRNRPPRNAAKPLTHATISADCPGGPRIFRALSSNSDPARRC